jgi:uncharacterized damage-inducible protein DinB
MSELNYIIESLKDTFDGDAWHGPSVMEVLSKIPADKSGERIGNSNSIIEIVLHMATWRTYTVHKLKGDDSYEVAPHINFRKGENWEDALQELRKSQDNLLQALATFDPNNLTKQVPNRKYSFHKLLHGVIQHDLYHQGQIVMITKQFQG